MTGTGEEVRPSSKQSLSDAQQLPQQVQGQSEVLCRQDELARLAKQCGQAGAVRQLATSLTDPLFGSKRPRLLLFWSQDRSRLEGAVLLYEYTFFGFGSGIFVPPDAEGERMVIAPPARREEFALRAATALLQTGAARLLVLSLDNTNFAPRMAAEQPFPTCATMQRTFQCSLMLGEDFDGTVAQFGPRTRRNLRAAKRQAVQRAGLEFVANAMISEQEFVAMSHASAYAVREDVARWRYVSVQHGGLLAGLRNRQGEWVALIGGRRDAGVTTVDWQINLKELQHLSLSLTMRSFLIEREIVLGTRVLRFEGGTPHPMRSGFIEQTAGYALLGAGIMRPFLVRTLIRRMLPKQSLLNTWLSWDKLTWHS